MTICVGFIICAVVPRLYLWIAKILIETYHIKEMKFSFILKKVWNSPGSTPPFIIYLFIYIYIDKNIVSTSSPIFVFLHFCIYSSSMFSQVILKIT